MFYPRALWSVLIAASLLAVCSLPVFAQDPAWGAKMFDVTEIKFGSVAKGADVAVQVRVKNIYKEDIQITNATTGCGCVSWDEKTFPLVIPSGQQRLLTLRLDTIRYDGERKSKATLALLDPVHSAVTQVELPVEGYIRRDIVIMPGAVNFGMVDLGLGAERKVEIHYAGRNDWKLTQLKVTNPNLAAVIDEKTRGNGLVDYELIVTLKPTAPIGTLRDQITMVTDDANNPQISVLVEAKIEADVVITDLQFGAVTPGQTKSVNVIIRGKKPFKVEELYREKKEESLISDDAFKVKLSKNVATVHSLPISFTAPARPGVFEEDFYVKVADRPQPMGFKVRGRILGQPSNVTEN